MKILIDKETVELALEALNDLQAEDYSGFEKVTEALRQALEQSTEQEPVAFITPLMEQQMFDDWCPYKGNPDPRTVWSAAIDSANGLLIRATPPQPQEAAPRKPLTDEKLRVIENKINPNMRWRSSDEEGITLYPQEYFDLVRAIEAAHGIKE